jgi:hypothetical protein
MQKSLYDQKPAAWERIAATHPSLAQMARHHETEAAMASALGLTSRSVEQWIAGANGIFPMRERQAKAWLANRNEVPAAPQSGVVLMVACDASVAAKVQKVLAMFNCEVVEV